MKICVTKWCNFHRSHGYLWQNSIPMLSRGKNPSKNRSWWNSGSGRPHFPHGMPDDGLMPPGPPSDNSSQDNSSDNHGNEGPDYPGDLDDKSPESSPPSMRPPLRPASPPSVHLKKAGLPHPSEIQCDMDDWRPDLWPKAIHKSKVLITWRYSLQSYAMSLFI